MGMTSSPAVAAPVREIMLTTTRNGQRRASYWSTRQLRMFPMPRAEAELLLATGAAVEITSNPFAS